MWATIIACILGVVLLVSVSHEHWHGTDLGSKTYQVVLFDQGRDRYEVQVKRVLKHMKFVDEIIVYSTVHADWPGSDKPSGVTWFAMTEATMEQQLVMDGLTKQADVIMLYLSDQVLPVDRIHASMLMYGSNGRFFNGFVDDLTKQLYGDELETTEFTGMIPWRGFKGFKSYIKTHPVYYKPELNTALVVEQDQLDDALVMLNDFFDHRPTGFVTLHTGTSEVSNKWLMDYLVKG